MNWFCWIQAVIALGVCGVAAFTDHRTGRIPNRLTISALMIGLVLGVIGGGTTGLFWAFVGAFATAFVPLILFKARAMGGGDVKLFGALGALLGAGAAFEIQMVAFLIGALQGVIIWVRNGQLRCGFMRVLEMVIPPLALFRRADAGMLAAGKTEIRFGPAIMAAAVLVIASRVWMIL